MRVPRNQASARLSSRNNGLIMVLTLLGILLLAGLLFYVINLGRHVNARIVAQHSADTAAISGAGWIARSFNTVAMNNVSTTNYLAMVNVFDALPLATSSALHEQDFLLSAVENRLSGINTGSGALDQVIEDQLELLRIELDEEVHLNLEPMDDFFDGYDMRQITHYDGPLGRGQLWRGMLAMENYSIAIIGNATTLALVNAVSNAQINLENDNPDEPHHAFMLPMLPQYEYRHRLHAEDSRRTTFGDFRRPVARGMLPDWADHVVVNRGPYDTVHGWRTFTAYEGDRIVGSSPRTDGNTNGVDVGDTDQVFGGGPRNDPGSGGTIRRRNPIEYRTIGTHDRLLSRVGGFAGRSRFNFISNNSTTTRPSLQESRFYTFVRGLADAKLHYIWSNEGEDFDQFAVPDWTEDYPTAAPPNPLPFGEIAYLRLDIKSRYERGAAGFMSTGSWAIDDGNDTRDDRESDVAIIRTRNWWVRNPDRQDADDPVNLQYPDQLNGLLDGVTVTTINGSGRRAWLYEYEYTVIEDLDIGITIELDADGNPIPQTAYFIQVIMWAGANQNPLPAGAFDSSDPPDGDDTLIATAIADDDLTPEIINPYDGFDPDGADAFGPVDLDHSQFDKTAESSPNTPDLRQQVRDYVRQHLTFLGVVRHSGRALMWQRQFDQYKTQQGAYAIAQASVFNNHSFDLWTQMWHAQLMPVDGYEDWMQVGEDELELADSIEIINSANVESALTYLQSLEQLAPIGLVH